MSSRALKLMFASVIICTLGLYFVVYVEEVTVANFLRCSNGSYLLGKEKEINDLKERLAMLTQQLENTVKQLKKANNCSNCDDLSLKGKTNIDKFVPSWNSKIEKKKSLYNLQKHMARMVNGVCNTGTEIKLLFDIIFKIIDDTEVHDIEIPNKKIPKTEIKLCGEKYTIGNHGYPHYHTGWTVNTSCQDEDKIDNLVSIVFNIVHMPKEFYGTNLFAILNEIEKDNLKLKVFIAAKPEFLDENVTKHISNAAFKFLHYSGNKIPSDGKVWNDLVKKVTTPFVLIANNITNYFGFDARLYRLLYEKNRTGATFVGGASRDEYGHWSMNCQQMTLRNYRLTFVSGYHFSVNECVVCDYITGPFMATTDYLKTNTFDENMPSQMLFKEYFIAQMNKSTMSVVCPDSMFYVGTDVTSTVTSKSQWTPIGIKHSIVTIKLAGGHTVDISKEVELGCDKTTTLAIPPSCVKELADDVLTIMQTASKYNITCMLAEGTQLSAVKMNYVFRWEVDGDIICAEDDIRKLKLMNKDKGLTSRFKSIHGANAPVKGVVTYSSSNWFVEMFFFHPVDIENLRELGLMPTKIYFNGFWLNGARNPGLYVRNRYGVDIYRHTEHWRHHGRTSGFSAYSPGSFMKCTKPGHNACLNLFSADGNIQFKEYYM